MTYPPAPILARHILAPGRLLLFPSGYLNLPTWDLFLGLYPIRPSVPGSNIAVNRKTPPLHK